VFKQGLTALGLLFYAVASHVALTQHWLWLAFALALAPLVLMAAGFVLRQWLNPTAALNKTVLVLACAISSMALLNYWASLSQWTEWIFLAQNVGANAALGLMFANTLRPTKTPLVTQFATILHQQCSAEMLCYTRRVTWAWVWFFLLMCLVSLGLFFGAPLSVWSAFINLLAWPLVGLMFASEFAFRRWAHPEFEPVSLKQGVQTFMAYYSRSGDHQLSNPKQSV
jgi:uncharacterized membrane protein